MDWRCKDYGATRRHCNGRGSNLAALRCAVLHAAVAGSHARYNILHPISFHSFLAVSSPAALCVAKNSCSQLPGPIDMGLHASNGRVCCV
jgi:hypothetical protein